MTTHRNHGERGVALIMALLTLLVLSLLAVVLYTSVTVGTKITGHNLRESQALNTAEAGIAEAVSRVRNNEGPDLAAANPARQVVQVFNCAAGSVPVLGVDSTGLATAQPAGNWLPYSTAGRGPNVLTIEFKTDAARTTVYRYDPSLATPINTVTGYPIYKITSTGIQSGDARRVVSEVIQKPFNVTADAALTADVGIDFSGNSYVCGHNHRADTPTGTGQSGAPHAAWELGSGDKPASWTTDTTTVGGSSTQDGAAPVNATKQAGFFDGPWDMLGMTQQDFYSWVGSPVNSEPANPSGVFYLDNNSTTQDATGNYAYHGGDGSGMLYVDGDLTINGNFNYRGLIYIEGDLKINGTCWILGAIVVKGHTKIKIANGTCTILYSKDAIEQNISKWGGQFVTLSWHEGL